MKKSINRNIAAAEYFVTLLSEFGVRDICISPGSRNTSLTVVISKNRKFKTHINVDERAGCFFALGLAKQTGNPVAVVTTSGTAAAELTPGIVEAYFSRVPLIICTADRPGYQVGRGANQTINQWNMFSNHVRGFYDFGLPKASIRWFNRFSKNVSKKLHVLNTNPGPIHFNIPFEKPFEPGSPTDKVDPEFLTSIKNERVIVRRYQHDASSSGHLSKKLIEKVLESKKILLSVGPIKNNGDFVNSLSKLARQLKCPIAADGLSRINFKNVTHVIDNFNTITLSSEFRNHYDPELIIHIGNAHTSKSMLDFFKYSKAYKIVVNTYGDKIDPSRTTDEFININPAKFCQELIKLDLNESNSEKNIWYEEILEIDAKVEQIKGNLIYKKRFPFEGRILEEVYSLAPEKSNLFLSNSMPIRDFDYFISGKKNINLYYNRGASGIDGIISSACGVGQNSDSPTTLVIGDLAFYHDLNSLYLSKRLNNPFVIILINNNGGGIFDMLPIASEKIDFEKYFKTPVDLNFEKTAQAFDLNYSRIKGWKELKSRYNNAIKSKNPTILEIKTNSKQSLELRRKFWEESRTTIRKIINENNA